MEHRGPDQYDEETYSEIRVGYFRLAITGGHQGNPPVTSGIGNWQVFLNGEIYNYKKLIVSHGLPRTESDSQVLADGLEKFGITFVKRLRGMFAGFAVSLKDGRIYCFRDPLGEKPLFYSNANGILEFASEVKALTTNLNVSLSVDPKAVVSYLQFGYIEEPNTVFENVKAVDRGCIFEVTESAKCLKFVDSIDVSEYEENSLQLRELMLEVVEEQFAYSGESAILLSSGIDSNTLLKLGIKFNRNVKSIVYAEPMNIHEREWVKASKFSIQNCQIPILSLSSSNLSKESLLETICAFDQPHYDSASTAYFSMFKKLHSRGIKVVFSGHGPDEFFWGYEYLVRQLLINRTKRALPERVFWETPANSNDLTQHISRNYMNLDNFRLTYRDEYLKSGNIVQRTLAEITHSYLSHNGLRQMDRLAMHNSIEPRTPFADSRIYAWVQKNQQNVDEIGNKTLFREFASEFVGRKLATRPKKGFSTSALWEFKKLELATESDLSLVKELEIPWASKAKYEDLGIRTKFRLYTIASWLKKNA